MSGFAEDRRFRQCFAADGTQIDVAELGFDGGRIAGDGGMNGDDCSDLVEVAEAPPFTC